jgi:hypothetical protein
VIFKSQPLRNEIDRLTRAQLLPILLIMFAFWIVCAVEWTQRLVGQIPNPRFWPFFTLLVTVYSGFQVFRLRLRVPGARPDSTGEREVAEILQQISSKGFVAFHDLRGDDRKIDHVVVGPSGIYAIETKRRSGSGMIDHRSDEELIFAGRIKDGLPLRHARGSANVVQLRLDEELSDSYTVKPLLVFLGNWEVHRERENLEVDVTTAARLTEYFDKQRPALSTGEIAQISSCFETAAAA